MTEKQQNYTHQLYIVTALIRCTTPHQYGVGVRVYEQNFSGKIEALVDDFATVFGDSNKSQKMKKEAEDIRSYARHPLILDNQIGYIHEAARSELERIRGEAKDRFNEYMADAVNQQGENAAGVADSLAKKGIIRMKQSPSGRWEVDMDVTPSIEAGAGKSRLVGGVVPRQIGSGSGGTGQGGGRE